jgi:hypothetical protein
MRHAKDETRSLDWFLRDPRCHKWIVQCSRCHQYGRRPGLPPTFPKYNFEVMFPELVLDAEGRCEQCQRVDAKISASGRSEV